MTTSENLDYLIKTLRDSGFNASELSLELEVQINSGFRSFNLYDEKDFGNELMRYKLEFTKDVGGVYQFSALTATHRGNVIIDTSLPKVADLDDQMSRIDWRSYFKKPGLAGKKILDAGLISQVYKDLKKLGASDDLGEVENYYHLIYKHWPIGISRLYLSSRESDYISVYEKSMFFQRSNSEDLDAILSYQVVSGVYDDLLDKVKNIELESKGFEVQFTILPALKQNPEELELNYSGFDGDDHIAVSIPFKKEYGAYTCNEYSVKIQTFPQIKHGLYAGINTELLEKELKDAYSMKFKDQSESMDFFNENTVAQFQIKLNRLFNNRKSHEAAMVLERKYLMQIDPLKHLVHEKASDIETEVLQSSFAFPVYIPLDAAVNLLHGRSIYDSDAQFIDASTNRWLFLTAEGTSCEYSLKSEVGISLMEIETLLAQWPLDSVDTWDFKNKLLKGYMAPITLNDGKMYRGLLYPRDKSLEIYDQQGNRRMEVSINTRRLNDPLSDEMKSNHNYSRKKGKASSQKRRRS